VYARNIDGKILTFGVSGMLYRSNVLMYDHQTESLWLQVKRSSVTGPMAGKRLETLPSSFTTWKKWLKNHPETLVLTPLTGYVRDYSRDPYEDYYKSRRGFFSFFKPGPGEKEKELVAGIEFNGKSYAFPLSSLRERGPLSTTVAGKGIIATFDDSTDMVTITDEQGTSIPHVLVYWFVWKGIHPETGRYSGKDKD
jgi:hypothetical protein